MRARRDPPAHPLDPERDLRVQDTGQGERRENGGAVPGQVPGTTDDVGDEQDDGQQLDDEH